MRFAGPDGCAATLRESTRHRARHPRAGWLFHLTLSVACMWAAISDQLLAEIHAGGGVPLRALADRARGHFLQLSTVSLCSQSIIWKMVSASHVVQPFHPSTHQGLHVIVVGWRKACRTSNCASASSTCPSIENPTRPFSSPPTRYPQLIRLARE
jgi:hypothetical protein